MADAFGLPASQQPANKGAGKLAGEQLTERLQELDARRARLVAAQLVQLAELDAERAALLELDDKLAIAGLDMIPIDRLRRALGL